MVGGRDGATKRGAAPGGAVSRRAFLRGAAWAAAAAAVLTAESVRETYAFVVSEEHRAVRGLTAPLELVLLTDFHLGPYLHAGHLRAWVDASNAATPDLVVVAGDLVDQFYRGDLSELTTELARLTSRLGVVAVAGNHDHARYPDLGPVVEAVRAAGHTFLVNGGVRPRDDLVVAGVDDFRRGRPDTSRAFAGVATGDGARVLVSHNPDIIPTLGPTAAAGRPVDLVLCGHTHGGQVKLPLVGPLVTSSRYGARFAEGWVGEEQPAFVSRGLGVSLVPLRFDCAPQVVVMHLVPA